MRIFKLHMILLTFALFLATTISVFAVVNNLGPGSPKLKLQTFTPAVITTPMLTATGANVFIPVIKTTPTLTATGK